MISWMQKHNKYLVWTIWVATIAFIGAGFVGWGSYNFGSKASAIAKVGSIEIKQEKLNMAYRNLYNQYNQMMQGKLDDKKAKELGLIQQAFQRVEMQTKILNFAKDAGIIVSDNELVSHLEKIEVFQKEGHFNKDIYQSYLTQQRLKAKTFEARLRDDLLINKVFTLLNSEALPLEVEAIQASMQIADKLLYTVLTQDDINLTIDETKLKAYWENNKENYMTSKVYTLSILWTPSQETNVTEDELKTFYTTNSFNYTDKEGKSLNFEEAKEAVIHDTKLKKTKKRAQKAYIAFKKGKIKSNETVQLTVNDSTLTQELWKLIATQEMHSILKPKVVLDKYATVKLDAIQESRTMTFEEAQAMVTKAYEQTMRKEALFTLADSKLEALNESNALLCEFITLEKHDNLKILNSQESLQFAQKLFTSSKEKGIITIKDKLVVYKITEQTLLSSDANQTNQVKESVTQIKNKNFETNFIKLLDTKYSTQTYMGGLQN